MPSGREVIVFVTAIDRASRPLRNISASLAATANAADLAEKKARLIGQRDLVLREQSLLKQQMATRLDENALRNDIARRKNAESRNRLQDRMNTARMREKSVVTDIEKSVAAQAVQQDKINRLERERMRLVRSFRGAGATTAEGRAGEAVRARQLRETVNLQTLAKRSLDGMAMSEAKLRAEQAHLPTRIKRINEAYRLLDDRVRGLDLTMEKDRQTMARSQIQYDRLGQRAARLTTEIGGIDKEMGRSRFFNRDQMRAMSQQMGHIGHSLAIFGAAGVLGFGLAANAAAKFGEQVMLTATQTSGSVKETVANAKFLSDEVIKQMQRFPATSEEVNKSFYDIFSSLDIGLKGGIRLMNVFQRAAIGGMTPLNDVTSAGITIMNTFGFKTIPQVNAAMTRMFAAVRFGRMNFQQLTEAMATIVPAAKQQSQSADSMLGAYAFLTRMFGNTAKAATSYSRAIELLNRQKFVENIQKKFGVSLRDSHNHLLDLETVIRRISPLVAKSGGDIANFFKKMSGTEGTIQARRALTFLIRNFQQYHKINQQVQTDNNEFGKSFQAMRETPAVQWRQFLSVLRSFVIQIGKEAIPVLVEFTKPLRDVIKWFQQLDPAMRKNIIKMALMGTALIALVGVVLTVVAAIAGMVFVIESAGVALAIFLGITAAVAAAAVLIAANWDTVGPVVRTVWAAFSDFASMLQHDLLPVIEEIARGLRQAMDVMVVAPVTALAHAFGFLGDQLNRFDGILGGGGGIQNAIDKLREMKVQQDNLESSIKAVNAVLRDQAKGFNDLAGAGTNLLETDLAKRQAALDLRQGRRELRQTVVRVRVGGITPKEREEITAQKQRVEALGLAYTRAYGNATKGAERWKTAQDAANAAMDPSKMQTLRVELDKYAAGMHKDAAAIKVFRDAGIAVPQALQEHWQKMADGVARTNARMAGQTGKALKAMRTYVEQLIPQATPKQVSILANRMLDLGKVLTPKQLMKHFQVLLSGDKDAIRKLFGVKKTIDGLPSKHDTSVNTHFRPDVAGIKKQAFDIGWAAQNGVLLGAQGLGARLAAQLNMDISSALIYAHHATMKAGSPSKRTRDMLGIPLMEGIIVGVHQKAPALQKAVSGSLENAMHPYGGRGGAAVAGATAGHSRGGDTITYHDETHIHQADSESFERAMQRVQMRKKAKAGIRNR